MVRVLVTGMSAVGKTALLTELARRGHRTVDTDHSGLTIRVGDEWLWDEARVAALLDDGDADLLIVQGTVRNQVRFYPQFDHILLLSAPPDVMMERLATRTGNPYGKNESERAEVMDNLTEVEPLLRDACCLEVVTTIPLDEVADRLLDHIGRGLH